jgi:hypothetical protein
MIDTTLYREYNRQFFREYAKIISGLARINIVRKIIDFSNFHSSSFADKICEMHGD